MKLQFLFFNKLNNKITEIVHELYGQPSYFIVTVDKILLCLQVLLHYSEP
jgi:hypothetical protein